MDDPAANPPSTAWRVLASEVILDNRWLRVERHRALTPRGVEVPEYYVLGVPDIVVVLALTEAREAVLVEQYRHGTRSTSLELPAGMVEPADPSPETAAQRELLEETGYRAGRLEFLGRLRPSPARQSNATHCFLALGCRKVADQSGDPVEDIRLRLMPVPALRAAARRCELPSQTSVGCLFLGLERLAELGPL